MLIKSTSHCHSLVPNDGCRVFEVLHPDNDDIDLPYSLAIAEIAPGESSYRHRLRQAEVYYVLCGGGLMHVGNEVREVSVGDAIVIPAGAEQWIENRGKGSLRFAAIVSPPWCARDDERL